MPYTVSDLRWNYNDSLRLIAGEDGLANRIDSCGILDYEMIPNLRDKYAVNFHENQIVLTTFLYAKDNPFAIIDAVKQLNLKNAAGLIIKNVFKLQIPQSAIRYANAKNFPIFLVESGALFFEDIVYTVHRQNELLADKAYLSAVLTETLEMDLTPEEIRSNALKLNMSFSSRFFCVYVEPDDFLTIQQVRDSVERFRKSDIYSHRDFAAEFKKGILFVKSGDSITNEEQYAFVKALFHTAFGVEYPTKAGISDIHNGLDCFRKAVNEAICSAYYTHNDDYHYYYYEDIGIYRLIFTSMMNDESMEFSRMFIEPIEEYDMENKTDFLRTLCEFVRSDLDYTKTAAIVNQHEQTIRYRIKRIFEIIREMNPRSQLDMEQLSIATKIYLAKQMLSQ